MNGIEVWPKKIIHGTSHHVSQRAIELLGKESKIIVCQSVMVHPLQQFVMVFVDTSMDLHHLKEFQWEP